MKIETTLQPEQLRELQSLIGEMSESVTDLLRKQQRKAEFERLTGMQWTDTEETDSDGDMPG